MPAVIKAGELGTVAKRLTTVNLADYVAEARVVLEEAKRQATQVAEASRRQAEQAFEEARKRGYATGFEEGRRAGVESGRSEAFTAATERFDAQHADVVAAMSVAIAEIDSAREGFRAAAEKDLLDFAVLVARKLTFAVGALHREAAQANFERALRLVEARSDLTVRVHPDDVASMKTFAATVSGVAQASRAVHLVPDETIAPGGCIVRSERTEVDSSLDTQVDEIVALLTGGDRHGA